MYTYICMMIMLMILFAFLVKFNKLNIVFDLVSNKKTIFEENLINLDNKKINTKLSKKITHILLKYKKDLHFLFTVKLVD